MANGRNGMERKKRLGDLFIEAKLIAKDNLAAALRLQVGGNRRLGYLLIRMGFNTEEQLYSILSQQMDIPIVKVENEFNASIKKSCQTAYVAFMGCK